MFQLSDIIALRANAKPQATVKNPPVILANLADSEYIRAFNYWTKTNCKVIYFQPRQGLDFYLKAYKDILITCPTAFSFLKSKLKLPPGNQEDFLGSFFKVDDCRVITLGAMALVVKQPTMQVLYKRMVEKFTKPEQFLPALPYTYTRIRTEQEYLTFLRHAEQSPMIAVDIENYGQQFAIDICGFAALAPDQKSCQVAVFDMTKVEQLPWVRKVLDTQALKVFQNGIYDCTYFTRYGMPVRNYYLDTMYMFWCWHSDMPLNLGLITSFWLSDSSYWKGLVGEDKYLYNALDCVNTLSVMVAMLPQIPQWVRDNYVKVFPKVFPCIQTAVYGPRVDVDKLLTFRGQLEYDVAVLEKRLKVISGNPKFKPASPKMKLDLLKGLPGCKDITGSDKVELAKVAFKGPLHTRIVDILREYNKKSKLLSTYADPRLGPKDTLLFAHSPAFAGTGRFATRASIFGEIEKFNTKGAPQWVSLGFQIQNIPEKMREFIHAPPGFKLAGIDGKQAESRATAYMCQDLGYIDAVENSPDFHSHNASKFFGIPFDKIFDVATGKRVMPDIILIAKRVNHGANYNMMSFKLIETMGEANLWKANSLLGLNYSNLMDIAVYLLTKFAEAYPRLKGVGYTKLYDQRGRKKDAIECLFTEGTWYGELIEEVELTGKLQGPTGFTRKINGDPRNDKAVLNAVVAHAPQSLTAMHINDGFYDVWEKMSSPDFWPVAQIHDEVLCCYRDGHEHLLQEAGRLMDKPITVHGRTFHIPPDVPEKGTFYWIE